MESLRKIYLRLDSNLNGMDLYRKKNAFPFLFHGPWNKLLAAG